MNLESALRKVETILDGINETENDTYEGWWETSTGAAFGKGKLEEIKQLVRDIYEHMDSSKSQ